MNPASKLEMVLELMKRTENCVCDKCGNKHVNELGFISVEEARALLGITERKETGKEKDLSGLGGATNTKDLG